MIIGQNSLNTGTDEFMGDTSYLFPQRGYMTPTLNGMGDLPPQSGATDTSSPGFDWQSLLTNLTSLWQTNQQMELNRQVNQINLTRAQQGLAPIVFDTTTASPTVKVAVAPDQSTKNLIMLALGAAALFWLITEFRKRR